MRRLPKTWTALLGRGLALGLLLGLTLLPATRTFQRQPEAQTPEVYTFVEEVKKRDQCIAPTGTNETALFERWRLPASGLTYRVDVSRIDDDLNAAQVLQAIQSAAAAWMAQGAPPLIFGGTVTGASVVGDGVNTISFGDTRLDVLSIATMLVSGGQVVEADITFDRGSKWSTNPGATGDCGGESNKFDLQSVATHEFGHWVGAHHTPTDSAYDHRTMYPFVSHGELHQRTLAAGDIASIPSQASPPSGYSGITVRGGDDDGGP